MKKKIVSAFLFLFTALVSVSGQDGALARQYYSTGEYEKAAEIYYDLYKQNNNSAYFTYYITCLMSLEEYDAVEDALKKEIKKNPSPDLYVSYGQMYERISQPEKASAQYNKAIESLDNNQSSISKLAGAFVRATEYDLAIQTYQKGSKILKNENIYAYNLADLYFRKGDVENMVKYYLLSLQHNPRMMSNIKNIFARKLEKSELDIVKEALYTQIQEHPDQVEFPELLEWVHIQSKDYDKALRQAQALDLRLEENGARIYTLGKMAENDEEFDVAIKAFEYIINQKSASAFFLVAKDALMTTKRKKITQDFNYTIDDIQSLEKEYEDFLVEYGYNTNTAYIMANLAELEALYLNNLSKAITVLNKLIEIPGVDQQSLNQAKIDLADYYLMNGERWEATLLYSQVDKAFKEAYLGELARFKNAKLSYFSGDFEWAQAQFDVLKSSTSRLISNDAIDLSVFISDNLGLDTTAVPMEMFAKAELLAFQNRYDEAFVGLDSINNLYPGHGLTDDIYFAEANMYVKLKNYDKAVTLYEKVMTEFPDEIRADNAIYALAQLYDNQLAQPDKAQALYERLFLDYSASTFAVDARKRYRILRGDEI